MLLALSLAHSGKASCPAICSTWSNKQSTARQLSSFSAVTGDVVNTTHSSDRQYD